MKTYSFRLLPGTDLRQEIERVVSEKGIQAGVLLAGVGSLQKAHLRLANAEKYYDSEADFEIVSLTGTVSENGCHIHISVSDDTGKTIGGHVSEGNIVRTTAEVVIGVVEAVYRREPDSRTGYDELVISDRE